jgi:hypothetical protein
VEREARFELVYFCLEGRRVTVNTLPAIYYLFVTLQLDLPEYV